MAEKPLTRKHWSLKTRESLVRRDAEGNFGLDIEGGAENGQFLLIKKVKKSQIQEGKVRRGELLLEVNQKRVPGMIKKDVMALIESSADPVTLVTVKKSATITKELKKYLATRFTKNSVDSELQDQIRENVHMRVVPCTTMRAQERERHGVDNSFISVEESKCMEKDGQLLESGVYEGNYYGTPKPSSDPSSSISHYSRSPATSGYSRGALIPSGPLSPPSRAGRGSVSSGYPPTNQPAEHTFKALQQDTYDDRPLPPMKEPPTIQSTAALEKQREAEAGAMWPDAGLMDHTDSQYPYPYQQLSEHDLEAQLQGEVIKISLAKTASGFGFKILGGEIPGELLQIGSIFTDGTADRDGRLFVGDVLVSINGISVLRFRHRKVVELFQSLPLNSQVTIEVRRGYPLPDFQNDSSALINIYTVKGPHGFGFSLGESQMGPVVKQIMDHPSCAQLREGDVILEINGENVRNYSYSDVVTLLKKCSIGNWTNFTLLREPTQLALHEPIDQSTPSQGLFDFLTVQLTRKVAGFGFKIAGGKEEGTQVTVGEIVASGAADLDGRLLVGDQITSINGQSVMDASHHDVVSLMGEAAAQGEVVLRIRRKMPMMDLGESDKTEVMPESLKGEDCDSDTEEIHHIEIHRGAIGFGFSIRGGAECSAPLCVGMIAEGGAAEVDGRLRVGDELLEINGYSTEGMLFADAFTVIYGGDLVKLITMRVPDKQSLHSQVAHVPPQTLVDEDSQLLFDEAMEKGHVNSRIAVCLFTGAAGSGKSHFMHLVLGLHPPARRQSTPLAKSAVRAISISRATVTGDTTMKWHEVTLEKMKHMIGKAIKAGIRVRLVRQSSTQVPHSSTSAVLPSVTENETQSHEVPAPIFSASRGCQASAFSSDTMSEVLVDDLRDNAFNNITDDIDPLQLLSIRNLEKEFVDLISRSSGSRELFEVDWVFLIDSGGQRQFTEILPAFVHNASAVIFVMKLNQLLSERPTVEFYGSDGQQCGSAYTSLLTNQQILMHNIRALQSRQCVSDEEKSASVFIAGTHRDLEDTCSETRAQKDAKLINMLRPVLGKNLAFHRLSIPEELMFPVNAKTPSDEDHKVAGDLRREIMKLTNETSVKIPLPWFVFEQFVLEFAAEKGVSILSKGECQQIAQGLRMSKEECDAALGYLVKLNIFLYYREWLPNIVFCESQVLLDKISELVEFSHCLQGKTDDKQVHPLLAHSGGDKPSHSSPVHSGGDDKPSHSPPVHSGGDKPSHSSPVHSGGDKPSHSSPVHSGGDKPSHSSPVHSGGDKPSHSSPVHGGGDEPSHSPLVHSGGDEPTHSPPVHSGSDAPTHSPPVHGGGDAPTHSPPVHSGGDESTHPPLVHSGDDAPTNSPPVHSGGDVPTHSPPVHSGGDVPTHSPIFHSGGDELTHSRSFHGGEWVSFRDHGIITIDTLKEFPKHYVEGLFTPHDLLKILIGLNVTAPISKSEYIMPCLLPELSLDEIDAHRQLENPPAAPLLVKYKDRWVPAGCFTILISYLQNSASWKLLLRNNIPSCLYRNCTTFRLPTLHRGQVTLIDSFEYLEVHIQVSQTNSMRVCPRVRNNIFNGLEKAAEILRYGKMEPEMAFFCPQRDDACKPELHLACIADSEWTCTVNPSDVGGELSDRHTVWLDSVFPALHLEPTDSQLMNEVAVKARVKWREVGCELGLSAEELVAISDSQPRPLRCFSEVFARWKTQKTAPYTWATIIKALQAPQVNQILLADTLMNKYARTGAV